MPDFSWQVVLLAIVVSFGLGGCNGNYKFNDSDYRPLGDPRRQSRQVTARSIDGACS